MNAAARRNASRRGWPRGLYEPRPGYYVWRHPDGRTFPIGRATLPAAKAQAVAANLKVEQAGPSILERIERDEQPGRTVADLLAKMLLAKAKNTQSTHRTIDKRITAKLGQKPVHLLTTADCAELIEAIEHEEEKSRTALGVRSRLIAMCNRGLQLGWMTANPAHATRRPDVTVRRRRLTLETYRAIRAKADEVNGWIGLAMDLALVTGMDRSCVSKLTRKDISKDHLEYTRGKTGMRVRLPLDLELVSAGLVLRDLVKNRTSIASRFVVHHVRTFTNAPAGSQVFVDRISKAFAEARDLAGLGGENPPTFHEIRSLAKRLYKAQGNVDTKDLLSHADDKTANIYADPRGVEALEVKVIPIAANEREVNGK